MKFVKKHVLNGLFFLIVIVVLGYISLEIFIPQKTIDIVGYKSYVVLTSSMEPDIMANDMIIIHKVKEEDLELRDAITFNVFIPELGRESEVTHYIGEIQGSGDSVIYKTQGATKEDGDYDVWKDKNNVVTDVTFEDIEGEVVLTIPYLGHAVNLLKDPIMVGMLVLNIIIIYALVKLIKKPKNQDEIGSK